MTNFIHCILSFFYLLDIHDKIKKLQDIVGIGFNVSNLQELYYIKRYDIIYLTVNDRIRIDNTVVIDENVIIDIDTNNNVYGIEILEATRTLKEGDLLI